ncbi:MAG: BON domain-containing protein [Oligoflexia bacterium]|nr:BON domain-containing protein [Oligoflexia bacterium]MBF0367635.1 BON domain-containing protein [Oligoflexia bacterium]
MKINFTTFFMFFVMMSTLVFTLVGCSSGPTNASTGQYVDDTVITTKIKADMATDKIVNYFQINVETYKGVVQLSGFVNTREQAERAEVIAAKVPGVQQVKNNLIAKAK